MWSGLPSAPEIPTLLWSGLVTGSLSGALAVSLVLTFRVSRVLNLAVGSFYVVGAFAFESLTGWGVGVFAAAAVAVFVGAVLGAGEDRFLLRPIRKQPPFIQLLATVGLAILVEGVVIATAGRQSIVAPALLAGELNVGGLRLGADQVLVVLGAAATGIAAQLWLRRGATGRAVAATTDDAEAAMMMGINVNRLRLTTYAAAGAIGASIGVLTVPFILVDFSVGLPLSLAAFVAAVIGGGLSPIGGWAGGLAVGVIASFSGRIFSHSIAEIITAVLLILIVLLLARIPAFRALNEA